MQLIMFTYLFDRDENVFVAGDLLWYPVEGNNKLRQAPDVMVVFGAKKGDRGSYMQWKEQGIPPQVSRWAEITTDPIRGKRMHRKEERGNIFSTLSSLFSLLPTGGNPKPIGGERKVQLIMFTYLVFEIWEF